MKSLKPLLAHSARSANARFLVFSARTGLIGKDMSGRIWTPPDCNRFLASYGSRSQLLTYIRLRKDSDDHEVSILIGLEDGDRVGRRPSKVSTMTIRPPQHGHRRAGVLVSLSASLCALPGEASGAASK